MLGSWLSSYFWLFSFPKGNFCTRVSSEVAGTPRWPPLPSPALPPPALPAAPKASMRLATILSGLAVLLLIYNLRTAASLWDAPPRIIAPATVRAQTGRLQPLVSDSGLATAAAPIRTFEAPTIVADPSAAAPRVLAGKPPFEPRTPSVCGGSGRSGVPVTPRAINYLPASCEGPPAVCAALSAVAQASQQHDGAVLLLVAAHDDASELAPFVEVAGAPPTHNTAPAIARASSATPPPRRLPPPSELPRASSSPRSTPPPPQRQRRSRPRRRCSTLRRCCPQAWPGRRGSGTWRRRCSRPARPSSTATCASASLPTRLARSTTTRTSRRLRTRRRARAACSSAGGGDGARASGAR